MQKMLFTLISSSSNAEVVVLVHFTFLLCRRCYSCSCHLPLMQKLLFLLISPWSYAGIVILLSFTFLSCENCCLVSLHLLPMMKWRRITTSAWEEDKINNSNNSSFHLPVMQKLFFSFVSPLSHAEVDTFVTPFSAFLRAGVAILIDLIFIQCKSCYSP